MQIVSSELYDTFFDLVLSCNDEIKLCAPFVKEDITTNLYSNLPQSCKVTLVTNINLKNFHQKSSDLGAIRRIIEEGGTVINFQRLHAKIYIFDDKNAIITSANLTKSGLKRNYEYGVLITHNQVVNQIADDYYQLCTSEDAGRMCLEHIMKIHEILKSIPRQQEKFPHDLDLDFEEVSDVIVHQDISRIIENFTGWKRAVFAVLNQLNTTVFTTKDLSIFIPYFQALYPNNNNIEAKIRQQLQELRDLGLVKFEGRGFYKKLWA